MKADIEFIKRLERFILIVMQFKENDPILSKDVVSMMALFNFHESPRSVAALASFCRSQDPIIPVFSGAHGYYWPATKDEWATPMQNLKSRAIEMLRQVRNMEKNRDRWVGDQGDLFHVNESIERIRRGMGLMEGGKIDD